MPFDVNTAPPLGAKELLGGALFAHTITGLVSKAAIGQFFPGSAGGSNATAGFDADSLVNPWDFILMLEGAVLFASSAVRSLEARGIGMGFAYPFTVRATSAGYGTAGDEEARAEIWMPLWKSKLSAAEARALLSEGRANAGGKRATNGVDFARAASSLGVDRGIAAFQRYGFQLRNGLSYFATPLSRIAVQRNVDVELLDAIDTWLNKFVDGAKGDRAPASLKRASRQLQNAISALCEAPQGDKGQRLLQVLLSLGGVERQLATSQKWAQEAYVHPVPPLSLEWLKQLPFDEVEVRLAASAASIWAPHEAQRRRKEGNKKKIRANSLRESLAPVLIARYGKKITVNWYDENKAEVSYHEGPLLRSLHSILARRILATPTGGRDREGNVVSLFDKGALQTSLADIASFTAGDVDDDRLADLLWGFSLLDFSTPNKETLASVYAEFRRVEKAAKLSIIVCDDDQNVHSSDESGSDDNAGGSKFKVDSVVSPPALYALLRLVFSPVAVGSVGDGEGKLIPLERGIFRLAASGQDIW